MDVGRVAQYDFTVLSNERVAKGIWRMLIDSKVASLLLPGQFVNLNVPGDGSHILKLPFSFARCDASARTIEMFYAVVGEGTERLTQMILGSSSTLLGPCGKGWSLPAAEGRALLVAGGIGLPPIEAAAHMLADAGVPYDVVAGARTAAVLLADRAEGLATTSDEQCRVVTCTDDGSAGFAGYTTQAAARLVAERSYAQIYTCGPNVMMAGVARLAREHDIACQASLERMMGCGFGACSCCNVALAKGGYALCCTDGPVFDAEEVAW